MRHPLETLHRPTSDAEVTARCAFGSGVPGMEVDGARVHVMRRDSAERVLSLPLLFTRLPAGSYRMSVAVAGERRSVNPPVCSMGIESRVARFTARVSRRMVVWVSSRKMIAL